MRTAQSVPAAETLGPVRIADIYGADGSEIGCCARTGPLSGPELGLGAVKDRPLPFAFDLSLGGSHRLLFATLGMETRVGMTSAWPDPSFIAAYLPPGARSLCLFYLLLLSLSEHVGFARAYTMASAAVVALIAGYVRAAFGNARAVPIAVMLIVPYARKVDWYQVGRPAPSE